MSEQKSWFVRRWKLLLTIATVVALGILVYAIRQQFVQTWNDLKHVRLWALLLMLPIEVLNYHAQNKLYIRLFATVDENIGYKDITKVSLELNTVNHIFPSGGVSGISYFSLRMRSLGVKAGKATLVQFMKLVLVFLSFEILLITGMFILAVAGRASNLTIFIGTSLSTLLVVGTFVFTYIIGSQTRINSFLTTMTRWLNRLIQLVRWRHPETINIERSRAAFDEFHENYRLFRSRWSELKLPFLWALLANMTEIGAIYVVYVAFGELVNVGAVILAYAIANFAGLVSVLPGGVGIYEGLMTAVLSSAGVPARLSLPVTVMYRIINTLIQLIPGLYFYATGPIRSARKQYAAD